MPEPTTRKGFLTIGRLILMIVIGGLGALLHWLLLPDAVVTTKAGATPAVASRLAAGAGGSVGAGKVAGRVRPTLGEILSVPYWQRSELILDYLDGADVAATTELFNAMVPEFLTASRSQQQRAKPAQLQTQEIFIYSHWAALDPEGMMAAVAAAGLDLESEGAAYALWADQDSQAAYDHPLMHGGTSFRFLAVEAMAEQDPTGYLHRLLQEEPNSMAGGNLSRALDRLAETDGPGALKMAYDLYVKFRNVRRQGRMSWGVSPALLEKHPSEAADFLKQMAAINPKDVAQIMLYDGAKLIEKLPDQATELMKLVPAGRSRETLESKLLEAQTRSDPAAALAAARALTDPAARTKREAAVLQTLSAMDPKRCLAELTAMGKATSPQAIGCVENLTRKDPAAALALVQQSTDAAWKGEAMGRVGWLWANANERFTMEQVEKFYPSATGDPSFMASLVKNKMYADRKAAFELAMTLTGASRQAAVNEIFQDQQQHDNEFTKQLIWERFDLVPSSGWERQAIINRGLSLAQDAASRQSATTVLNHWELLSASDRTPQTYSVMTDSLYKIDPTQASTWVRDLPPGPARDSAAAHLATAIADDHKTGTPDFDAAWQWASAISDPELRFSTLRQTVRPMLKSDPSVVPTMINDSPLTDAEKSRLRASYLLTAP